MVVRFAIRLCGWSNAAGRLQFHIMRIPKAELSQLELRIIVLLCNENNTRHFKRRIDSRKMKPEKNS